MVPHILGFRPDQQRLPIVGRSRSAVVIIWIWVAGQTHPPSLPARLEVDFEPVLRPNWCETIGALHVGHALPVIHALSITHIFTVGHPFRVILPLHAILLALHAPCLDPLHFNQVVCCSVLPFMRSALFVHSMSPMRSPVDSLSGSKSLQSFVSWRWTTQADDLIRWQKSQPNKSLYYWFFSPLIVLPEVSGPRVHLPSPYCKRFCSILTPSASQACLSEVSGRGCVTNRSGEHLP